MKINGYELVKFFYGELETNSEIQKLCKPSHIALYMWLVELQNRLGWEIHTFGLPTEPTMFYSAIGNGKTFRKNIQDLVAWGFMTEVQKSVNASQSRKVSLQTEKLRLYLVAKKESKSKKNATVKNTEAEPKQPPSNSPTNGESEETADAQALLSYKTDKQEKPIKTLKKEETSKEKIVYVNDPNDLPF